VKHLANWTPLVLMGGLALPACLALSSRPDNPDYLWDTEDSGAYNASHPKCAATIPSGQRGSDLGINTSWQDYCRITVCGTLDGSGSTSEKIAWFNFRIEQASQGFWFAEADVTEGSGYLSLDVRESTSNRDAPPPASASVGNLMVTLDPSKIYAVVITAISGATVDWSATVRKSMLDSSYCN
jgi:hypothetical protein